MSAGPSSEVEVFRARALAGVAKLPRRVKCAMLGWDALAEAEKQAGS